jgi:hypothetical protein
VCYDEKLPKTVAGNFSSTHTIFLRRCMQA